MCKRFEEWKKDIKLYCEANDLNFDKLKKMSQSSNKNMLLFQFYNPTDGKRGLLDETPMPAVLWVTKGEKGLEFEQTEHTHKYLSM